MKNIEGNQIYKESRLKQEGINHEYPLRSITVVMQSNWKEIPKIISLMNELNVEPFFVRCNSPDSMRIDLLSSKKIKIVLDYLFSNVTNMKYLFRYMNWLIDRLDDHDKKLYRKQLLIRSISEK